MAKPLRIYLSFDSADAVIAEGLKQHLNSTFAGQTLEIHDKESAPGKLKKQAGGFEWLHEIDLFLIIFSADYLSEKTSNELEAARRVERDYRPALQIAIINGKSANIPVDLQNFPVYPHPDEPVMAPKFDKNRQLQRVAGDIQKLAAQHQAQQKKAPQGFGLGLPSAKARLHLLNEGSNLHPVLAFLHDIADSPGMKKSVYEMQDSYSEVLRQGRLVKISLQEYLAKTEALRHDIHALIDQMEPDWLRPNWPTVFLQATRFEGGIHAFFTPNDEIIIPDTLNLPVQSDDSASSHQVGVLSYEQKTDFRRQLLLAFDAFGVENYARAYQHCEFVRSHIDPQSAQLYEYLMLSFIRKETPDKIVRDAAENDKKHLLSQLIMFATRLKEYQAAGICPSSTAEYNLRSVAEELSEAMCRYYDSLPNNYLEDTGERAKEVPPNRVLIARLREAAEFTFRSVHPFSRFLEILINELCGGGKFQWIKQVELSAEGFVFFSTERIELETNINELIGLLNSSHAGGPEMMERLKEYLGLNLISNRDRLLKHLETERIRQRRVTEPGESLIRFMQSCLLGQAIFGDEEFAVNQSFMRLVLEVLLPELVVSPAINESATLRWLTLNDAGEVIEHPDSKRYQFNVTAVIQYIIRHKSGQVGWMKVQPNIKESVYLQHIADTDEIHADLVAQWAFTDFRKPNEIDARRTLITCFTRWMSCYKAFPERGQDFLDKCIREICYQGLLEWLHFDPNTLVTHYDSQALGFDARQRLAEISALSIRFTELELSRMIVEALFDRRILPAYNKLARTDEKNRNALIRLLQETLSGYKLYPQLRYLDFVFAELTEEIKLHWIDIDDKSKWKKWYDESIAFDPIQVLNELYAIHPQRYRLYTARERVARHRHQDQMELYLLEISEFPRENRRPEREICINVIRKMKAIFRNFPLELFLELPMRELSGKGRIRWNAMALGVFPVRENHYENKYYNFNYRYELYDLKNNLLGGHFDLMQEVLRECGEI